MSNLLLFGHQIQFRKPAKKNTVQKCKHQGGNKTKGKTDISQYLCHKMDLFYASACGSKLPDDKKIRSSMVPTDRSEAE
jgi:hypothetical protein